MGLSVGCADDSRAAVSAGTGISSRSVCAHESSVALAAAASPSSSKSFGRLGSDHHRGGWGHPALPPSDFRPLPGDQYEGSITTAGNWSSEKDSAAALDEVLAGIDLFHVHTEVRGRLVQPRFCQDEQTVRIDRVLVPNRRLLKLGWATARSASRSRRPD